MAIYVDVISRLDERSAAMTARQIDRTFSDAGAKAGKSTGDAMSDAIDKATRTTGAGITTRFSGHGVTAGKSFGSSFNTSVAQSTSSSSAFSGAVGGYSAAATKAGSAAGRAMGLAFTTAAGGLIGAAGLTLFKGFERYQSIDAAKNRLENLNRTMQATGRAGVDVGRVMETVTEAVTGTPFAMDQAMSLATRALSSATGPLDRFMKVATDGAAFAGRDIESIGSALLKVANTGKVSMEELQNELAGIPILPQLQKQFGVTGAEMAKLISDGKVGLNDLMVAIETTSGGLAKSAGDTIAGAMENAQTAVARIGANVLGSVFGKPTEDGNDLVEVLKTMTARLDDVNAWVTANSGQIRSMFQQGADVAGDLASAVQQVLNQLDRVGVGVDDVVMAFVAWKSIQGIGALTTSLGGINTMLSTTLPASAATGAAGITAALARIVPPLWLAALIEEKYPNFPIQDQPAGEERTLPAWVPVISTWEDWIRGWLEPDPLQTGKPGPPAPLIDPSGRFNDPTPGGEGGPAGASAERRGNLTPSEALGPSPSGSPLLPAPGTDGSGGGPKLPDAPVVPYDSTLPPGIAGMPPDASVFSAESSFLDARHALAEKRARLTQLEASADATEEDRLNARNDVIAEERDCQAAEMRMHEARQNQLESMTKKVAGTSKDLSELGTELDKDFGISKGLSGIVENFVKAAGNILAAPFLQALGMIEKANPNEGSGLTGILAANGVFGPQYTPAAMQPYTTSQPGIPSGGYANVAGIDAALLSRVPAGRYTQEERGDLTQGLADCSSAVEDLVNLLDGRPTSGASMWTGNAAEWLSSRGFVPGPGGLGDMRVAFNSDHMQATLPGGTPFNWGSDAAAAVGGRTSMGADDPALTHRYHRPVGTSPTVTPATAPSLTIPQSPAYNTNPGLTPPLAGVPMMPGGPLSGGMPQSLPLSAGQGGVAYPSQGGNSGNLVGGLALDGALAAAGAADLLMPGAGAAAKIGIQLLNRTIGYAAQNAGIAASGLMETFGQIGDNPRGGIGGGWLGKIAGGIAGAAPALPNLAGGQMKPLPGDQQAQSGNVDNSQHNTVQVTAPPGADGDQHGRHVTEHLSAMHMPPGRQ